MIQRITDRDVQILKFINEFGFCQLNQIMKHFVIKQSNSYKIMRRLCKHQLVIHEQIFIYKPGVYRLTQLGASYTDLVALEKIPLIIYAHQLKVVDVFIRLIKAYPDANWLSERRLFKDQRQGDILQKKHLADGMLWFENDKQVAIEVELSLKGKNRIDKIFKAYVKQSSLNEVWYFCHPKMVKPLKNLAIKMPFIKIYELEEFLNVE